MSNGHLADQYAPSLGTLYVFLRTCLLVSSVNRNEGSEYLGEKERERERERGEGGTEREVA